MSRSAREVALTGAGWQPGSSLELSWVRLGAGVNAGIAARRQASRAPRPGPLPVAMMLVAVRFGVLAFADRAAGSVTEPHADGAAVESSRGVRRGRRRRAW